MKYEKAQAPAIIRNASMSKLLDLWEATTPQKPSMELAMVRSWLMDEIESRDPKGFEEWLDKSNYDDIRNYVAW